MRQGASPIEHVVVLMLENRSFDHMLGFLDHGGLEPVTKDPLPNPENPSDPNAPIALPFALEGYEELSFDPNGYPDVMRQLTANVRRVEAGRAVALVVVGHARGPSQRPRDALLRGLR